MTESALLRDFLDRELGFDGVVMSDWFATRSTEASARAALDLVMPGPVGPWGDALVAAVRAGDVDPAIIDDKVLRILRLAARVGALEGTSPAPAPAYDDAEIASTLRRTAAAGFVLARNDRGLLPLDPSAVGRIAVIGPNAVAARTLGGGSATVLPAVYRVAARRPRAPRWTVASRSLHSVGVRASTRVPVAGAEWLRVPGSDEPGVEVRFLDADGAVLASERRRGCAFTWLGSFDHAGPIARIEVHTVLRATEPGAYTVGASGLGRYRMSVDGRGRVRRAARAAPGRGHRRGDHGAATGDP